MESHYSGLDETNEERMRFVGTRFELGVELDAHVEGAFGEFHRLYDVLVGRGTADGEARFFQRLLKVVIEFVSVAMALFDERLAVATGERRSLSDLTGIGPQTHGAALDDPLLVGHQVDDQVGAMLVEFAAVGVRIPQDVACVFDNGNLHTEANTKIGQAILTSVFAS